jgi:hypothetical protein
LKVAKVFVQRYKCEIRSTKFETNSNDKKPNDKNTPLAKIRWCLYQTATGLMSSAFAAVTAKRRITAFFAAAAGEPDACA